MGRVWWELSSWIRPNVIDDRSRLNFAEKLHVAKGKYYTEIKELYEQMALKVDHEQVNAHHDLLAASNISFSPTTSCPNSLRSFKDNASFELSSDNFDFLTNHRTTSFVDNSFDTKIQQQSSVDSELSDLRNANLSPIVPPFNLHNQSSLGQSFENDSEHEPLPDKKIHNTTQTRPHTSTDCGSSCNSISSVIRALTELNGDAIISNDSFDNIYSTPKLIKSSVINIQDEAFVVPKRFWKKYWTAAKSLNKNWTDDFVTYFKSVKQYRGCVLAC